MKTVEDLTELNKIKLNQLFKYINNYIFQAIRSKKHFYCFDNKKNIGCNLYKIGRRCSLLGIQGESSCYMSVIKGKSCIFREYNRINGKTCCVDIACTPLERKDDIRVRYIKLDYRIYLFK